MRHYKIEDLTNHLNERVIHGTYAGHKIYSITNSLEFFRHVSNMPENNGYVPYFVVQDEFGGTIERIIASVIVSHIK